VMWFVMVTAGLLQARASRFFISGDGNSYLDIASAYLRKDFANAINGYWSPLYSWLIALVLWVFKPSGYWETTILHLLNFAGLLLALLAFEFFFKQFLAVQQKLAPPASEGFQLPASAWWVLGYGLFLNAALQVLSMYPITSPDHWVCMFTFLAFGLVLKIWIRQGGLPYFIALGFVLGFGYLTKAFFFPMAFVFLGVAWLGSRAVRQNFSRAVVGFIAFVLVSGPFVFALSKAKHRLTYGDVGKMSYASVMDWLPEPIFWEGENGSGTPKHPARVILSSPRVYEFAEPVAGSYPMWYDPSYWKEGIEVHFHPWNELRILRQSVGTFFLIFLIQLEYFVGFAALLFCSGRARDWITAVFRQWFLWVPAAVACLGFASVLVEGRYVAPFLVILWLAAFAACLSAASLASRRVAIAMILAVVLATGIKTLKYAVTDAVAIPHQVNENWQAAEKLKQLGVRPGDRVALIGVIAEQHWLRLAGVKAVAELRFRDEQEFWTGDAALQSSVFRAFAAAGSSMVVAARAPATAVKEGWIPLGDTDLYAHRLPAGP
jgi:4-amino-4-deoxy-L-arabinose transferase-like glycosyltransferase